MKAPARKAGARASKLGAATKSARRENAHGAACVVVFLEGELLGAFLLLGCAATTTIEQLKRHVLLVSLFSLEPTGDLCVMEVANIVIKCGKRKRKRNEKFQELLNLGVYLQFDLNGVCSVLRYL